MLQRQRHTKAEQQLCKQLFNSSLKNRQKAHAEEQGKVQHKESGRKSSSMLCFRLACLSNLCVFRHLHALHSLTAIHRKAVLELPLHVLVFSQLCQSRPPYMLAPAGLLTPEHEPAALAGSQGRRAAAWALRSTSGAHNTQHK